MKLTKGVCTCPLAMIGRMMDGQRLIFKITNLASFHDTERQRERGREREKRERKPEVFKIDSLDF